MKILHRLTVVAIPCVLVITAYAGGKTPLQQAPARTASVVDPLLNDDRARSAGGKLFARECAACHGSAGEGRGKALPLTASEVANASPGALLWVLTNGSLRQGMPSFAHLPEAQRWQIVKYLKGLH